MLIMAGMFFDTLEQNSTGAMGTNLKLALGIDNDQLALINTATVIGDDLPVQSSSRSCSWWTRSPCAARKIA